MGRLFLALLLCAVPLFARAADDELPATVKRLTKQLNEPELGEREAAEKALIGLGPAALPHLPAINDRTPAEVKQRLETVRSTLEKTVAESAAKASLVTLSGKMTLTEALAALEKQSQNKISGAPQNANVTLDLKDVPYWEALDQVLDQAKLTINPYSREPGMLALAGRTPTDSPRSGRASYSGVFRFEPTHITAVRDLRNPALRSLRLTLEISWEPRVAPIAIDHALKDIKATGDDGQPLSFEVTDGSLEASLSGVSSATVLELPLAPPERSVKKIAKLEGTLHALVPGRMETFTFDKLAEAKNAEQKQAGVTVVLREVRKNQELYEVRMLVQYEQAANALESHRGWIDKNEAYLLDPQGNKVEPAAFETGQRRENEQAMSFLFALDKGLTGHKFEYRTPAALVKLPVKYELKDIDLP